MTAENRHARGAASRVLAIGMDGAEPEHVEAWMRDGSLPSLAALAARGSYGRLASMGDVFSDAVWPTFCTGCGPGRHGYYYLRQVRPGTNGLTSMNNRLYRRPFWWHLRRRDVRTVIFDVPKVRAQEAGADLHVVGWGEHYPFVRESHPPQLLRDIERRYGKHPHQQDVYTPAGPAHETRMLDRILHGVDVRTEVTFDLMQRVAWDLLAVVFSETHSSGHQFCHYLDPGVPSYSGASAAAVGDGMHRVYCAVDRAIGRLLDRVPADTNVMVFSLHGMRPDYSTHCLMGPFLTALGYQIAAPPSRSGPVATVRRWIPGGVRDIINRRLPLRTQTAILSNHFEHSTDWTRSRAVAEDSREGASWIRINLAGREPHGIVQPGAEYEALCSELEQEVARLTIQPGGGPAVEAVWRTQRIFDGPHAWHLPDLVIKFRQGASLAVLHHPRAGNVSGTLPVVQNSHHTGTGFLAAAGRQLRQAAARHEYRIHDLAPTLLALLGAPVPRSMEGRPLHELLDPTFLENHPIRRNDDDGRVDPWTHAEPDRPDTTR